MSKRLACSKCKGTPKAYYNGGIVWIQCGNCYHRTEGRHHYEATMGEYEYEQEDQEWELWEKMNKVSRKPANKRLACKKCEGMPRANFSTSDGEVWIQCEDCSRRTKGRKAKRTEKGKCDREFEEREWDAWAKINEGSKVYRPKRIVSNKACERAILLLKKALKEMPDLPERYSPETQPIRNAKNHIDDAIQSLTVHLEIEDDEKKPRIWVPYEPDIAEPGEYDG